MGDWSDTGSAVMSSRMNGVGMGMSMNMNMSMSKSMIISCMCMSMNMNVIMSDMSMGRSISLSWFNSSSSFFPPTLGFLTPSSRARGGVQRA